MQRICAKDHGGPKSPSVVPFEILNSEGPFEVASFEQFGLEWPFNMAAMMQSAHRRAIYPVWNAPLFFSVSAYSNALILMLSQHLMNDLIIFN